MEDASYQWDEASGTFVPFHGELPEVFDAATIHSIAEQGAEAGYGADVVASARRFGAGEVARPHRPEYVQVALGELGEALMKDGEACTAHVARAIKLLTGEVLP